MNKILLILVSILVIYSCSYEPVLTNKKYDFKLQNIFSENKNKINTTLINYLLEKNKVSSENSYDLYFTLKDEKEIVSSNEKGDPTIFKIKIRLNYSLKQNEKTILTNKIIKEVNYNNIDDKFELLKYEENILNNLIENISNEILMSITTTYK